MTPKQQLIAARELITDQKNWCQGTQARDECYRPTMVWEPGACKFCAIGAVSKVVGVDDARRSYHAREALKLLSESAAALLGSSSIIEANDHNDWGPAGVESMSVAHQRILRVFDRAIENA